MAGLRKVEYVMSQKGAPQVLLDGYLYAKNKDKGDTVYWRCVNRSCSGKCTTVTDFVKITTQHSHPPSDDRALKFVSTLRKRAREETTPMQQIYNNEVNHQEEDLLAHLPSFPSVSSAMYRHRRHNIPPLPASRAEVDLQDQWTTTQDGRRFLLFADGEENKILAFCSEESLEALQSADYIYMDGTFSSCPALWNQVYIIHAMSGSTMYPLVFALLDDDARFPPRLWNHHGTQGPRTNNNLEGFHSRIGKTLQHRHPNVYRFIELIKNIENGEKAKVIQINFGAAPPPKKAIYKEKEQRLSRLKDQLRRGEKSPMQFLDAVGPLMMMKM